MRRRARNWDSKTGQELLTLKGHTDGVKCVVFSPDGKQLASTSTDRTVKVWDAENGTELRTLKGPTGTVGDTRARMDKVGSVAYSPEGRPWPALGPTAR